MAIDRCIPMTLCCAALLTTFSGGELHASCAFGIQGEGRVSAVLDARTFRLDDGREVRLAGIELPHGIDAHGTEQLASLIHGRHVTLHGPDDRPDRYGRQPAFVTVEGSRTPVQSSLLANGQALVSPAVSDKSCSSELFAAEATARAAKRGVWAGSPALKNAERPDDILAGRGRFTVVEGTVSSARLAGATFFVNFGRRWTQDFAVTISRRMMPSFEAAGIDLKSLRGKKVRVRGWVERRGGPRIEATHPGQIEMVTAAHETSRVASGGDGAAGSMIPKTEGE